MNDPCSEGELPRSMVRSNNGHRKRQEAEVRLSERPFRSLFGALRNQYFSEIELAAMNKRGNVRRHVFSLYGLLAFQIGTTVWETILNRQFLSDVVRDTYRDHLLFEFEREIEKWSIVEKTRRLPALLFGKSLDHEGVTYSDLNDLIEVRNSVPHFKTSLYEGPDKAIRNLKNKKRTYPSPPNVESPWTDQLCSTEAIRFCVNAVANLVRALAKLETADYRSSCAPLFLPLFEPITDRAADDHLRLHGRSPVETDPR